MADTFAIEFIGDARQVQPTVNVTISRDRGQLRVRNSPQPDARRFSAAPIRHKLTISLGWFRRPVHDDF